MNVFRAFQVYSAQLASALKSQDQRDDDAFDDHLANTAKEIFDSGLDVVVDNLADFNVTIHIASGKAKDGRNAAWKITSYMLGYTDDVAVYRDDDLCFGIGADGTVLMSVQEMNRQLKAARFDDGIFHYDWEERISGPRMPEDDVLVPATDDGDNDDVSDGGEVDDILPPTPDEEGPSTTHDKRPDEDLSNNDDTGNQPVAMPSTRPVCARSKRLLGGIDANNVLSSKRVRRQPQRYIP
jgi:hypothetical protein